MAVINYSQKDEKKKKMTGLNCHQKRGYNDGF